MKIPQKYSQILFAIIMSILMTVLMTAIVTLKLTGLEPGFLQRWFHACIDSLPIAFLAVLVVAPIARKLVERMT